MGSFNIWHWLVVLVIVVLVFGTKRLSSVGSDLGKAIKGFKDGMKNGDAAADESAKETAKEAAKETAKPISNSTEKQ